jgi:hypothetical protein
MDLDFGEFMLHSELRRSSMYLDDSVIYIEFSTYRIYNWFSTKMDKNSVNGIVDF